MDTVVDEDNEDALVDEEDRVERMGDVVCDKEVRAVSL